MATNEKEEQCAEILQTLSEGIALNEMVFDENAEMSDYRIIQVNDAFYSHADCKKGVDVIGSLATELYGMKKAEIKSFWQNHKTAAKPVTTEYTSPENNRCFSITASPFKKGKFVTTFQDITEQKKTEENLKIHEIQLQMQNKELSQKNTEIVDIHKKYFELYNFAPVGYFSINESGIIKEANLTLSGILGINRDNLLEKPIHRFIHKDDADIFTLKHKNLIETKKGNWANLRMVSGEGNILWCHLEMTLTDDNSLSHIILNDISQRKAMQESLSASEKKYRQLHESIRDGVISIDLKGAIADSNSVFQNMLGYTHDELNSLNFRDITPEKWYKIEETKIEKQMKEKGFTDPYEKEYTRKDGSICPVEISVFYINDENNKPTGMWAIVRNITERKKAEDKIKSLLAEKELILKEVHHRIKNNMNTIYGLLVLQAGTLNDPKAIDALEEAGSRVRCMQLLYDKLYLSTDFTEISVAAYFIPLIDEIISNFPNCQIVKIEKHIDDFILDAKRLQPLGIIINELLTNIMKYAFENRNDGIITVTLSSKDKTASLAIADNGNGIPESVSFENSTGFGLVLVNELTKQLEGTIRIERGQGTKIVLEVGK